MSPRTAVVVIWLLVASGGLWIAVTTRIGPVLLLLPGQGHGLHVGDVVGFGACCAVGAVGTRFVLRPS